MWAWLYLLGHTHFPKESLYHNGPRIDRSLEEKRRAVFVILTFNKYLKKKSRYQPSFLRQTTQLLNIMCQNPNYQRSRKKKYIARLNTKVPILHLHFLSWDHLISFRRTTAWWKFLMSVLTLIKRWRFYNYCSKAF